MGKILDTLVVVVSCRWESTMKYIVNQVTELSPKHLVMWKPIDNDTDAEAIMKEVMETSGPVKLLVIVNTNKDSNRYFHIYKFHIAMESIVKACVPFMTDIYENAYCDADDTMSDKLKAKCDEQLKGVEQIFKDDNPFYFNKESIFN